MKKQSEAGFAIVELVLVVVLVAAIAGVGYYVWHGSSKKPVAATTVAHSSTTTAQTAAITVAPQINNPTDLNSALQALNQADLSANNTDSSQLSSQASGF